MWMRLRPDEAEIKVLMLRTEEAKALIGLHVRQQHLGAILEAENAKVAWDALKKTYKNKTAARKLQLRHELSTLKMQSGESVATYVGRAQDLYWDLIAAGSDIKPDDLSFSVLAGLSSRFEGVVTVFTTTKEELDPVEKLLPKLQVFEQRHGLLGEQDSGASGSATAVAYVAKGGSGKASMPCHKCGKLGHFARECRSGARVPEKPKTGKKCYTCDSPDHLKKDWPKKEKTGGRQGIALVAREGPETRRWIVDSGASQHMAGIKKLFSTLKMLEPGTRAIKFGNKGFLEVAGVGTVELRCETSTGERLNFLQEVAYVPDVTENLFSVKKATAVGAEVVFRGEVCEMSTDGEVMLRAEDNAEGMSVICQPRATW
ncbi:hypothetical protein KFL_013600025 [Klebsormidium nitens]|uniref:CCHC-type domain-containing protein n=1 Tax=Klebsormidium nitens TaxID=105231 RepID=A0A1Y1IY27_KLENI|nr:hypothetical protein KFL_013600025 [Klebsormidium nitens]|eukprot:GAQ93208.1 hypothetical protein KFL_013600025 [Klebsormidium nitens]